MGELWGIGYEVGWNQPWDVESLLYPINKDMFVSWGHVGCGIHILKYQQKLRMEGKNISFPP